jgi:IS6 family transposase
VWILDEVRMSQLCSRVRSVCELASPRGCVRGFREESPSVASAFAGFRFPPDVFMVSVCWYLRYGLSYRLRSPFHERGIDMDHVTPFRWVERFTRELIDAARPCRHAVGGRRFVDEKYVKVDGVRR